MFNFNLKTKIIAKAVDINSVDGLSILGPDGRIYVLYYQTAFSSQWKPIPFVETFPT